MFQIKDLYKNGLETMSNLNVVVDNLFEKAKLIKKRWKLIILNEN